MYSVTQQILIDEIVQYIYNTYETQTLFSYLKCPPIRQLQTLTLS